MTIFGLNMMVKSGLEKIILKFNVPLQRYLLTSQANLVFLGRFFCTGQQQRWRGNINNIKFFTFNKLFQLISAGVFFWKVWWKYLTWYQLSTEHCFKNKWTLKKVFNCLNTPSEKLCLLCKKKAQWSGFD